MLLSNDNKLRSGGQIIIFVHVPKVGGATVVRYFRGFYGEDRFLPHLARKQDSNQKTADVFQLPPEDLEQYDFIAGHMQYGLHKKISRRPAIYIGVVRDPIQRLISDYYYNRDRGPKRSKELAMRLSLEEYILHKCEAGKSQMTSDFQVRALSGTDDVDDALRVIDRDYLFACQTEQIDLALSTLATITGGSYDKVRANVSSRDEQHKHISPEIMELLRQKTQKEARFVDAVGERFTLHVERAINS